MKIHTTHSHPARDVIEHDIEGSCVCGPTIYVRMRADGDIGRTIFHYPLERTTNA